MTGGIPWLQILAVSFGAAIGALARWFVSLWLNAAWPLLPLGTLAVNCVGGLMIGACMAWFGRMPSELMRLLLVTGFLGGLTTFSTFSAESLSLLMQGEWAMALVHTAAHVFGALAFTAAGYALMSRLIA